MAVVPAPTARPRAGRWFGGVCAGLAARWGVSPGRIRAAFALATLLFGLGALIYAAAWLILPGEGEDGTGTRGIVLLAQACGALLGLVALGALGGAATVFGFGWVVVALAVAILAGALLLRRSPAWALLPVAALVLPSAAPALAGIELPTQTSARTIRGLPAHVQSGLGLLTIDLRHVPLPSDGDLYLKVNAGVRRTLIALPHDRCVKVAVNTQQVPTAVRAAATALGRGMTSLPDVTAFGRSHYSEHFAPVGRVAAHSGPTLHIDFASDGGSLVVRDYPDDVNPDVEPDWPGYPVYLESRPVTTGVSRGPARAMIADWRRRRAEQAASKQRIDQLLPGPCAQQELFP